jgi:hypothetical protein
VLRAVRDVDEAARSLRAPSSGGVYVNVPDEPDTAPPPNAAMKLSAFHCWRSTEMVRSSDTWKVRVGKSDCADRTSWKFGEVAICVASSVV